MCHKWKAGRKGSGSGAGGVRYHATKGVVEERQGGGSGSQAEVGSVRGIRSIRGSGSVRGSPYNHPPLDKHQLDVEESEIGWKGIEPKVRARM